MHLETAYGIRQKILPYIKIANSHQMQLLLNNFSDNKLLIQEQSQEITNIIPLWEIQWGNC